MFMVASEDVAALNQEREQVESLRRERAKQFEMEMKQLGAAFEAKQNAIVEARARFLPQTLADVIQAPLKQYHWQ